MPPPSLFEFRLSTAPASPLPAVLLLGVLCAGSAFSQPSQVDPPARQAVPDLNRLQQRVLDFWSLVTRGQKHQALGYVAEGHDHFLNWNLPPVQVLPAGEAGARAGVSGSGGHDARRRSTAQLRGSGQFAGPAKMGLAGGHLDDPY